MDIRKVWPLHDNVQDGPRAFGRFLAGPRDADLDDPYWRARIADGSISLTNPTPSEVTLDASAPADFVAAVNAAAPEEH